MNDTPSGSGTAGTSATIGTSTATGVPDGRGAAASRAGRRTVPRRALTVAGATAAALVVWALAGPVAGIDLAARSAGSTRTVGPGAIAAVSLVAGLAAWALLALMERLTRRPGRVWTIIAAVVLVLSLPGPLGGVGAAARAVLAGLHLAVAAVLIPGLPARRR